MKSNKRDELESQLVEMRKRLVRDVNSAEEALAGDLLMSNQTSSVPTHAADADVEGLDCQVAISMNEESLLEQVEEAMERIRLGTYGICQQCEQSVSMERLEAIPYTALCIECARIENHKKERPVTGEPCRRW